MIANSSKFFLIARDRFLEVIRDLVRVLAIATGASSNPDGFAINLGPVSFGTFVSQAEHNFA